jgi:predicted branched-subunit amino acid permease
MSSPPNPPPHRRSAAWRGARDALALPAWVVSFSLLGVGSLARDAGLPAGAAVLATILIWAAPAQAILFAGISAGTSLFAVALAISLSSLRFLPMTLVLLPMMRREGRSPWAQALLAHYVAVSVWVEASRRLPDMDQADRAPYFLGFANACIVLATLFTAIGYHLAAAVPPPLAAGLLAMTPIFFTVSMCAGARTAPDWLALGLGFILAPVATVVAGSDFDLLTAGLVGGTLAYALHRRRRRP